MLLRITATRQSSVLLIFITILYLSQTLVIEGENDECDDVQLYIIASYLILEEVKRIKPQNFI